MLANRIQDLFSTPRLPVASADMTPAFVACPVPVFANYTAAQQSFIAEVYRRAQELTQSQLHRPARRTHPEFSVN